MPDVRPEDFGATPVSKAAPRPEDFGAKPVNAPARPTTPDPTDGMSESDMRAAAAGRSLAAPVEGLEQGREHATGWLSDKIADMLGGMGKGTPAQVSKAHADVAGHLKDVDEDAQLRERAMDRLYKKSSGARATGIATDLASGLIMPGARAEAGAGKLARMAAGAKTGAAYGAAQPATGGGDYGTEKLKQTGLGATLGAGITGVADYASRIPGAVKRAFSKESGAAPREVGSGAEKLTDELQRARDVKEGAAPPGPTTGKPSEVENTAARAQAATNKFREALNKSTERVDVAPAMTKIDSLLKGSAIDPKVRASLEAAKKTIAQAIKNEAGGEIIQTARGPMTVVNNKMIPAKAGLSVPMLDEVRQSINAQINARGDQALDARTKSLLSGVVDSFMGKAPESYKTALADLAKANKGMEKYDPAQTVLGKTTSGDDAAQRLTGSDAQKAINKVLGGDRSERDIKDLVEFTKHNPENAKYLRQAVKDWLVTRSPTGEFEARKFLDRWNGVRGALDKTGMYEPAHMAAIDTVIKDLSRSEATQGARQAAGSTAGYIAGAMVLHPHMGAHAGRKLVGGISKKTTDKLETILEHTMEDPEFAAAMAGPPNSGNIAKIMSIFGGREAGEQSPPPARRPSPVGISRGAGIAP